jgi:hypothetical protein
MVMDGLTEEQAQAEIDRINEEKEEAMSMMADASVFNDGEESPADLPEDKKDNKQKQDEPKEEKPKEEKKENDK